MRVSGVLVTVAGLLMFGAASAQTECEFFDCPDDDTEEPTDDSTDGSEGDTSGDETNGEEPVNGAWALELPEVASETAKEKSESGLNMANVAIVKAVEARARE
jgi:hypothetical protein